MNGATNGLREFHQRRLEAEKAAARKSICREAASAHRDLARLHAEQLARLADANA